MSNTPPVRLKEDGTIDDVYPATMQSENWKVKMANAEQAAITCRIFNEIILDRSQQIPDHVIIRND